MRLKEAFKTLIMFALVISILLMAVQLWVFSNLDLDDDDLSSSLYIALSVVGLTELAGRFSKGDGQPLQQYGYSDRFDMPSSVTLLSGEDNYSTAYDADSTLMLYSELKPQLVKYIGGDLIKTNEGEWNRAVAQDNGILYDYGRDLSLSLLLTLANEDTEAGDLRLRYVFQTEREIFIRSSAGEIYSGGQGIDIAAFESIFSKYPLERVTVSGRPSANDRRIVEPEFFDELTLFAGQVYPSERGRPLSAVYWYNPVYNEQSGFVPSIVQHILGTFDFNPGAVKKFTESDGATVYVETFRDVSLSFGGRLRYHASRDEYGIALGSLLEAPKESVYEFTDIIAASQALADRLGTELLGGEAAAVRFKNSYFEEDTGVLVIEFDYSVDGIRVVSDSPALRMQYRNGFFVLVEADIRSFAKSGTEFYPLNIFKQLELYDIAGIERPFSLEICYNEQAETVYMPEYVRISDARGED